MGLGDLRFLGSLVGLGGLSSFCSGFRWEWFEPRRFK